MVTPENYRAWQGLFVIIALLVGVVGVALLAKRDAERDDVGCGPVVLLAAVVTAVVIGGLIWPLTQLP